jgi:hypothetical protein
MFVKCKLARKFISSINSFMTSKEICLMYIPFILPRVLRICLCIYNVTHKTRTCESE